MRVHPVEAKSRSRTHLKTKNMKHLETSDLYNPQQIRELNVKGNRITPRTDQAFQEYPKKVELWQKLEDGRLMKVCGWLKKSIVGISYADTETKTSVTFEPPREYKN